MNQAQLQELLSAYLDGFLSPEEEESLRDYLEENPGARAELEQMQQLSQALQELPSEPLPQGFQAALNQKLAGEKPPVPKKKSLWHHPLMKGIGIAAAAALLLAVGIVGFDLAGAFWDKAGFDGLMRTGDGGSYDLAIEDYGSMDSMDSAPAPAAFPEAAPEEYAQNRLMSGSGTAAPKEMERKIIRNAGMTLETQAYQEAFEGITALAGRLGGYVVSSYTHHDLEGAPEGGSISIRVESPKMEEALAEIAALGKVRDEHLSGDDVTAQYYDIENRLAQYEIQKERLLELYAQAANVGELIQVESELSRINMEIDSLEGQLRYYTEMTDLAGIHVDLVVPREYRERLTIDGWDDLGRKITTAFIQGINTLLNGLARVFVFLISLLPFIILLLIVLLILRIFWKRRKKKQDNEIK